MEGGWLGREDPCDPLEIGTEEEGRLQQMFCHRAEDETWGLDLEDLR